MLVLRSSPPSPFGRKVKIAADVLGLSDRLQIVKADTTDANDTVRQQNPLGKVPVLLLEDGTALYDSRVIVEYLDMLAGGGRIIPVGLSRFDALGLQALADGLLDAALLQVYEVRMRDEGQRSATWTAHQSAKVSRALTWLEERMGPVDGTPHVGEIALACALGYLDLRFGGEWRRSHPGLVPWLDGFAEAVPSFGATRIAA